MNCFLKYIINRTIIKIFSSKMRSIYDVILGTILLDEYHLGSIWKEINGHKLKLLNYCMLEDWLIINERKGKTSWWARRAKSSSSSSLAHSKCEADKKPRKEWRSRVPSCNCLLCVYTSFSSKLLQRNNYLITPFVFLKQHA